MSRAYVAVTDNDWFDLLRSIDGLDEANFWTPSGRLPKMQVGEPVLFKLHAPINKVAGGAFFSHGTQLPVSLAWQAFGEKNGAVSLDQMRARLAKYRRGTHPREDYTIGCMVLLDPFFLEESDWFELEDFHPNIVSGKYYDLESGSGREIWGRISMSRSASSELVSSATRGSPTTIVPRLGQGAFRVKITDVYERRCAVTEEKALPVLQAAHIKPVAEGGSHLTSNGILLRSDVHALFDNGYLTVTPEHRIEVSSRLKDEFDNGEHYRPYHGRLISVPRSPQDQPSADLLTWHNTEVFR